MIDKAAGKTSAAFVNENRKMNSFGLSIYW